MILGKFYDRITWMALGVWFSSYYSVEREGKKLVWSKTIASHVRLIRPSNTFRGSDRMPFLTRSGATTADGGTRNLYIYTIIRDRKRQIASFIPMTHTPLFLIPTLIGWVYRAIYILYIIPILYMYIYINNKYNTAPGWT